MMQSEFVNWSGGPVNHEKAPQPLNIISELPFLSKTTYKDTFSNVQPSHTMSQKKKNEKSPY